MNVNRWNTQCPSVKSCQTVLRQVTIYSAGMDTAAATVAMYQKGRVAIGSGDERWRNKLSGSLPRYR